MKINFDKETLKELRGKLLDQEKHKEQLNNQRSYRSDLLKESPKNVSEHSENEQVENEEEMEM